MKFALSSKIKLILWIILASIIGIFCASFFLKNFDYKNIIKPKENTASVIESLNTETTLKYSYFLKNYQNMKSPKISAKAYLIGDLDTGEIILEKNKDTQYPLASVSKLMTALVTSESMKLNDVAKVSKKALVTYGQNGNLKNGEKIKIIDLLYPLLLESSNDAAEVLAEYFNHDFFIKKMNQTAERLQLSNTSFKDPSGLSPNNKSTVFDMFKLVGFLNQKNAKLFKITTQKSYSNGKHSWFNNNQFLKDTGYIGGKSGYTDEAMQTVVSLFSVPLGETGTRNIAIALLQSKDRFKDVENILKYLKNNVYYGGETDANTEWVKENNNIPEIYDQDFVDLFFGGDIMLDRGVENSVNKNFKGDYSALFDKLDIIKNSDISFANIEGPMSDIGKDMHNLYSFRMDPSVVPALKGAGFSVLSVANNHVGDWGREAYLDTLNRLKENEILYTGGGIDTNEAENPIIIEKYGMKIGYLGFSDVGPNWMKTTEENAGILLASNPKFEEIINNASKLVDYLVVSFHFGDEYKTVHNKRQEYLAHKAINSGAKIVIGHHPHVVEDIEIYSPKDCIQSSCMGLIAYSLGNFIFDQGFSTETMQGMLLKIRLNRDGNMSITKNTVKLNKFFQPNKIILGREEKLK